MESEGVKGYKLMFEAEVEYLDDCLLTGPFSADLASRVDGLLKTLHGGDLCKRGQCENFKGMKIFFKKTEKGWQVESIGY
jgi:hypothetical protein